MAIPFIMINLDRPRKLRFGMGAMVEFEQLTGIKLMELNDEMSMDVCSKILWIMLKQEDRFLLKMAQLMYRTADGSADETAKFKPYELLGVFMWFSSVKEYFAANFPHFFRPAREGGELRREDILPAMQAQIRALTDGDVTKLQAVYNTDCWAALTELDNKAREAEEFKKRNRQNS